ncbi:lysophospholipase [Sphingomonas sp. QA11]|uniref:alpha/beta hydrolase n=1 Tax=Sphingomonas sp. QA11 TaxID=2950605 RepID=UPI00234BCBCA|nr:alpha/beta hydrolase [Sphingomonas sp. QA11]WCM28592.1 lysophospholipase [Sphingomonas sp. QA11]
MSGPAMRWVSTAAGGSRSAPDSERIPLTGMLLQAGERPSRSAYLFLRPAGAWHLMPLEEAIVARGIDLLAVSTRYARNEALAVVERGLLDVGAWIRFARTALGYERINLLGWSGSGTQAAFYQEQATRPTVVATPDGAPLVLADAGLESADGLVFLGAHTARARLLADAIDPSIGCEEDSETRDGSLDLYAAGAATPPYDPGFLAGYRAAQLARVRRISGLARERLSRGRLDPFVVPRTMADPHFLDPSIDPNGRAAGRCWLGSPALANISPAGIARVATPEAWLSQWSIDDSQVDAVRSVASIDRPLLVVENGADDAVPPAHLRETFAAAASPDKTYRVIPGASHSYAGQPAELDDVANLVCGWAAERD